MNVPAYVILFLPNGKEILILQAGKDGIARNSHATVQRGIIEIKRLTLIRLIDA
jgi:hypothetical protein